MAKASILIVEDDRLIASCITQMLQTSGYRVCGTASTGEEGIAQAFQECPDLILMDIRLKGGMDGITAAARITESANIPIIFVSAWATTDVIDAAMKVNPRDFIAKPFRLKSLLRSVDEALRK